MLVHPTDANGVQRLGPSVQRGLACGRGREQGQVITSQALAVLSFLPFPTTVPALGPQCSRQRGRVEAMGGRKVGQNLYPARAADGNMESPIQGNQHVVPFILKRI